MSLQQILAALEGLRPGAAWALHGDTLDGLEWLDTNQTRPTDAEITSYVVPTSFLSRDLFTQLTVADYTAIKTAVAANDALGLLWDSLKAQGDAPIETSSARFQQGWAALSQALGTTRASQIATALGIPTT